MKKVIVLASMLSLSLLTSATLAGEVDLGSYDKSDNGFFPEAGILKARKDCRTPGVTFIKNAFPSLTNGQGGSVVPREETYSINLGSVTVPVTMTISWLDDNSFEFNIVNGVAHIVGVTAGTNNFLYDYAGKYPDTDVVNPGPVEVDADLALNKLLDGTAPDVNHLDLCLSAVDNDPPVVSIVSPEEGETVADTILVTATVTDNIEVFSVEAFVGDAATGDSLGELFTSPYEWTWDTTQYPTGSQTLTVIATDTSGNESLPDSVTVTVVRSAASCEGLIADDDPDQGEGCNPSGVENIQISPDNNLDTCAQNNGGEICTLEAFLLTPDIPSTTVFASGVLELCDGPNAFPDPRVNALGVPFDFTSLDVFAKLGGAPDPVLYPKTDGAKLILDGFTFGNPCFAVVYSERNFALTAAFANWPNADDPQTDEVEAGLVFIKTQFPEYIPDIEPFVGCYDEIDNPDLQETGEATYQTTAVSRMIEQTAAAMTNACFNPKRLSSRDKSFSVLNTKEHCGFDFNSSTGPADVLECKFGLADTKFDALELALDTAAPFLISPKFANLNRKFNQARSQFDKKNATSLGRAIGDLKDLLFQVATGDWTVTEENYPGDAQMRIENLIHRVTLLKREVERQSGP